MTKLNATLARRRASDAAIAKELQELGGVVSTPKLFSGQRRTYQPRKDDGETKPAESQLVQVRASAVIDQALAAFAKRWDQAATVDWANCTARASVIVPGGVELLKDVPVTVLMYLIHQVEQLRILIAAMPEQDPAVDWIRNADTGLWQTTPVFTQSTAKVTESKVVVPATPQHPAQITQTVADAIVGTWETIRVTGAIQTTVKRGMLERINHLLQALHAARETANTSEVVEKAIGDVLCKYVLGAPA